MEILQHNRRVAQVGYALYDENESEEKEETRKKGTN